MCDRAASEPTATPTATSPPGTGTVTDERLLGAQLFNETWRLMERADRTREDDDRDLLLGDLETIPGQPRYW